jgi:putative endonuclease
VHGERAAARYLKRRGYKVLLRNVRTRSGELDLVCRHRDVLVFVEVKTRGSFAYGRPLEALQREQRKRLVLAAQEYLAALEIPEIPFRFDVVEVLATGRSRPRCRLLADAFDPR